MSHQEKTNYVSLITTLLVSVPYLINIFLKYQGANLSVADEFSFWSIAVLWLLPLRIVAEIIIYIVVSIITTIVTKKDEDSLTDERDKLIGLKSARNGSYVFIAGVLLAMGIVSFTKVPSSMFITIILAGFMSELAGIISKIYYYKK